MSSSSPRLNATCARLWLCLLWLMAPPSWAQLPTADPIADFKKAHPVIRYAADPDFAPIDFVESGRHSGLAKDYLDRVARGSGLRFERVVHATWAEALAAFQNGEVDLLSSAFVSPGRRSFALFTQPYLRPGAVLLTRVDEVPLRSLADLGNRPVAVVAASVWMELLGEDALRLSLRSQSRLADALRALDSGEVDALISDPVTALEQARRIGLEGKLQVAVDLDMEIPVAMAVRPDWPELQQLIDLQLAAISVEDETRLRARWIRVEAGAENPEVAAIEAVTIPLGERGRIEALLAELKDEDTTGRRSLEQALALEVQADALVQRIEALRAQANAPATEPTSPAANLQRFLLWRASLPERASFDQLQQMLDDEEAALEASQSRQRDISLRLRDLRRRQAELPAELEALRTGPVDSSDGNAADAGALEAQLLAGARQRLALAQVNLLRLEMRVLPTQTRELELQLDRERANVVRFRQRVTALQDLQRDRVVREAEAHLAEVQRVARGLAAASASQQTHATEVLELAETGVMLAQRYARAVPELQDEVRKSARVSDSLALTRQRLAVDLGNVALGRVLLAERRQLDREQDVARARRQLEAELAELRLEQIDLHDRLSRLVDEAGLNRVDAEEGSEALTIEWQRQDMLGLHRNLLGEAIRLSTLLQSTLEANVRELRRRQDETRELRAMIDRRLVWLPTHRVEAKDVWQDLRQSVVDFVKPSRWSFSGRLLLNDFAAHPISRSAVILLLALFWWLRWRMLAALRQTVGVGLRQPQQSMAPVLRVAGMSLLAAAYWPLLMLLLGRHLQYLGAPGKFSSALGATLLWLVPYLYALTTMRLVTMNEGLGRLLGWDMRRLRQLYRLALQLSWIVIPSLFVVLLQVQRGSEQASDSLGRPALLVMLLVLALVAWRSSESAKLFTGSTRSGLAFSHWRQHINKLLMVALLVLAALHAAGYGLVSFILFMALAKSLLLVGGLLLLRDLLLHWLLVQERKLSQQRYQTQMQSRLEVLAAEELSSDAPALVEPEEITVESISGQTRRLLRAVLWTAGGLSLLWLWSDLLPAVESLDAVKLWQLEPVDGETVGQIVSLRDVLLGLLTIVLTFTGSRNLPGLLEIAILQRFPFDNATRYAITSVSRYVIFITGVIVAAGLLGLRWSNLQWMAAALTVGLGFGLQEIFANFVSGLILLFERPFRVGDTITIGPLSGTVTRIRTRATTILDWDNREIVIPNKSFITGDLINWTLSDTTTRITVKVGAAYGCEPDKVLSLLREVAEAHPRVLREPKPTSWLMAFGASSIDFELRVFVPEIRDRLPVSTELATRIHRRFREAGIEIPFPQLDLHLRSGAESSPSAV